jgi:hypothetical protein
MEGESIGNKHWIGMAGSQKEREPEAMQKDRFGGSRKIGQNMETG